MRKIFGFRSKKGVSPFDPSISLGRDRSGHHKTSFQPGYHIRDKDLGEIHKAASVGNVAEVQQVLLLGKNGLNEKDKMNRTALHLACANGHSAVVALLLERKCLLNLCDSENKTALMKAVECQEEECATLLLEHGADPNVTDANGNTALHYAVICQNISLAAKLLSYDANIEARNEDALTPLLLAISERQQQMVEFLVKKEANIHAVDKMERTALILAVSYESMNVVSLLLQRGADVFSQDVFGWTAEEYASLSGFNIICQLISEYKEKRPKTPPEKSNPVDTTSEEDSLSRFSNKPGADSWPPSDDEVLDFETKHVPKPNLAKLLKAFQQSKRNEAECGIARRQSTTFSENNNSDSEIEDVLETFPKPSPGVQGFPHPAFPRPDPLPKPLKSLAGLGLAQVEEEKKHKSSEVEVSDHICDAADESRLIQQRKSGGNNKQEFPAMENKGSDSSEPGVPRKEIEKKNNDKWTPEECVVAPVFEKTNSLTDGLLQVNDDSILRKVDQDDRRPARKTAYEKKKVSDSGRKAKDLLRKYHMLQDEIASLRLEIDAVQNQNREDEKKYSEDIKNLQQAMKSKEEIFTQAIFQYTGQLTVLRAENTMLNSELENNRQNRHRLETEVESYRSRLAAAIHDHEQGQTSQRDLELAFQKAHDERLCLQDQMKCHVTKLKSNSETASQQLPKVESKFNKLKMKPHQTRDDLRGKTLMLECVQRDLRQAECQKQEIEHMDQNEQGKVNEYLGNQESFEERLAQLQSENMLLRQHLDDAQNKADSKEKTVISIQEQFQQMVKNLHAESEKQRLMLEERNKELINKWNHLEERMCQYENEEAEEALVRQLPQELADSLKKQSPSEAPLEVMSRYHAKLEVEARDLKNLHQLTSQSQETQDQHTEAVRCAEKTQDHIQKLEMENAELQTTVKKQAGEIEQLQKNLLSIRLIDDLPAELETVCSQCLHMNAKIQVLREELLFMTGMQKKCAKLEKNNKKLEQKIVDLKSRIEMNMTEHSQVEQYKQETEERARQDLVEKLTEVNMLLQIQAASQENLEQAREEHIASLRSQMEPRIKELESELFKMETSQADLEKYKKLYLEELKVRKSLENKLDKTNWRLAEMSTELEVEKQQNRSLLSTLTTRPVLEPPLHWKFQYFNMNLSPKTNMLRELDRSIIRELEEVEAELASDAFQVSSRRSSDGSNVYDDQLLKAKAKSMETYPRQKVGNEEMKNKWQVIFEEFTDGFTSMLSSQAGLASSDKDSGSMESGVQCSISAHSPPTPSRSISQAGSHQELGFEEPEARPLQETPGEQEKPDSAQGKGLRRFKRKHLTAIECQHLAQSHLAASQSFGQIWTSRDPNHGLYPRPRTKRGTRGRGCLRYSLDFFLAGQQRCTNDMAKSNSVGQDSSKDSEAEMIFAVGSPCALPLGGDGEARLHSSESALPARKRSRSLEDERNPAPGTSPWDGVSKKTPWRHSSPLCTQPREARLEAEVGVGQLSVEPGEPSQEVEDIGPDPVPDSHYGLLGTLPSQEPPSHICSLPSEVLRHIFAFLPMEDLYWNLSLVCHLWREVIRDPLFIPWKKLYHRYLMNEEQAVSKVDGILSSYGIEKESDLCVLNLIRYTATTKCSPSVDPGQALWSLRDHLLLPEAEACVRQHLPDLYAAPAGVNVWALVAAIVLLSSSVSDIQQLLFCLRRPSSTVTVPDVTETLYCIAVLLYAMREKGISISNRIHYNIFYCLYLQENSCTQASGDKEEPSIWPGKKTTIQLTHEQQLILSHKMEPLQVVKIMAFAGTGKTSTLVKYAEKWSQSRFLYVTFNKSIAKQAELVFPSNVICKTFHSMAYGHIGRKYQLKKKLNLFKLTPFMVNSVLTEGKGGFIRAKLVCKTLENFFASADEELTIDHVPIWCKNSQGQRVMVEQSEKLNGVLEASRLWDNMQKLGECKEEAYHMTHDGYLKLWQLSKPLLASYDAIFVDEAQDCTPAIMNIVLSQPCGKIFVGDPHQQIYTFRGAVNALFTVPHTHVFYLTQSFRFGVEIAYVGATILDVCKRVRKKTLVGGNHQSGIRGDTKGQVALLSRTNANVFDEAVRVTEGEVPARIHLIGGIKSFGLDRIIDIWTLLQPEEERRKRNLVIKDRFIRRWAHKEGFSGFKRYVTAAEDKELEAKIAVVEKYNIRIPELVARIERCHIEDLDFAEYILGTVHKAKGLEFDTVHVLDDFVKVPCAKHNLAQLPHFRVESFSEDEWNLLYVAVTRAKKQLIMTKSLENILTLAGEYFLQAELTSNVLKTGVVRCCVGQCSNAIPVDAVLTMRKLPITYSNRKENKGGYLCHSCVEQRIGPLAFLTASPEQVRAMDRTVENVVLPRHEALLFLVF